jgi:DNA-binding SARP family transcriptional activator
MSYPLEIRLFRTCEVQVEGQPLPPLRSRKGLLLIAMLTLRHGREVDREFLASILWTDSMQAQAFYNLRQTLVGVRRALGPQADRIMTPSPRTVQLDLGGAYADVLEFDRAIRQGDEAALETAIDLYRGPLMADLEDEWLIDPRETRQMAYLTALSTLAGRYAETGAHDDAVRIMQKAVAAHPQDESLRRGLMRALAASGQLAAADSVYQDLTEFLHRRANTAPDPETRTLFHQLHQVPVALREQAVVSSPPPATSGSPESSHSSRIVLPVGAVPVDSPFYLERAEDAAFLQALGQGESTLLIKGARQMGKTSMLARGILTARDRGACVVHTDLETYGPDQKVSMNALCLALAQDLADGLNLDVTPEAGWDPGHGPGRNLERYLREHALRSVEGRLVWALDSVDALTGYDYSSSVFGLFRSWHNRRALEPGGPWRKLTLILLYSTEAHLLIRDRHQSPFNVGFTVGLTDFSADQVRALNEKYGRPLETDSDLARLYSLLSGHPYLTSMGLALMRNGAMSLNELIACADTDEGPFGSHLHRILIYLEQDPALVAALLGVLNERASGSISEFYRLRSAGIVAGPSLQAVRMRCMLYQTYLSRHLLPA